MTLHVNLCVIAQRDIRNVVISVFFLCLRVLSFLFSLFFLTWFHLHYFGGVCVKAICWCCEEKLLPIPMNLSCCAVDPGRCFECHLLDENCKCNLQEHLQAKAVSNLTNTIMNSHFNLSFSPKNSQYNPHYFQVDLMLLDLVLKTNNYLFIKKRLHWLHFLKLHFVQVAFRLSKSSLLCISLSLTYPGLCIGVYLMRRCI